MAALSSGSLRGKKGEDDPSKVSLIEDDRGFLDQIRLLVCSPFFDGGIRVFFHRFLRVFDGGSEK